MKRKFHAAFLEGLAAAMRLAYSVDRGQTSKIITQKILALIQFYLNHKPFMRSKHEHLIDKTPAEILTGKPHKPWLEMLGFSCNINQAA